MSGRYLSFLSYQPANKVLPPFVHIQMHLLFISLVCIASLEQVCPKMFNLNGEESPSETHSNIYGFLLLISMNFHSGRDDEDLVIWKKEEAER